jgi:hypothetical protein
MPRGDRTGPGGMGPMTGRGAGYCAGSDLPGYTSPYPGRGVGWGRGGGRGRGQRWRHWYYATGLPRWARFGGAPAWQDGPPAPPTKEQEVADLKAQAQWLKEQFEAVNERVAALEKEE